jgi:hypothetical protein
MKRISSNGRFGKYSSDNINFHAMKVFNFFLRQVSEARKQIGRPTLIFAVISAAIQNKA